MPKLVVYETWKLNRAKKVGSEADICDQRAGQYWIQGTGPYPPAHPHCQCRREYSHTVSLPLPGEPGYREEKPDD